MRGAVILVFLVVSEVDVFRCSRVRRVTLKLITCDSFPVIYRFSLSVENERADAGRAEPVSRDQILRRKRYTEKNIFQELLGRRWAIYTIQYCQILPVVVYT